MKTLRKQMIIIFVSIVLMIMLIMLVGNMLLLERFFISRKVSTLESLYETTGELKARRLDERFVREVRDRAEAYNVAMISVDEGSGLVYFSTEGERQTQSLQAKMEGSLLGQTGSIIEAKRVRTAKNYNISTVKFKDHELNYLMMWGYYENGDYFLMLTPIEGIQQNAVAAGSFTTYLGLSGIVVGVIAILFATSQVTRPIKKLTVLSQKMTELDFKTKYTGHGCYEVDLLGKNFNEMSMALEKTITNLKNMNLELRRDIEAKEKAAEAQKAFLSDVSHELKTPLALIQGYAEGLQSSVNEDEESRNFYCEVIMDEAEKMNQMVKKLMTLNSLESGYDDMTIEHFSIKEVVEAVVANANILIKQKGATIDYRIEDDYEVWGDEFKVEEVVTNYLTNALNHLDGEKRIEITIRKRDEGHVRIGIFNTGRPIADEDMEKIWDKFYKADKARSREYGGTGVGLSIVKAIMTTLGQDFGAVNYDNGVQFYFELEC